MSVVWIESEDHLLDEIKEGGKVVICFTAPSWCIPCVRLKPHYAKAAEKSEAKFVAVDIDENPWAEKNYQIQSVPTILLHESGEYQTVKGRTAVQLLNEVG